MALDRPFTYLLPPEMDAGVGSLVQVPFHGRAVRGWILGEDEPVPRMLGVKKVLSPVAFFDEDGLELMRWVADRYVAPLAAVIGRALPPRVVGEEARWADAWRAGSAGGLRRASPPSNPHLRPPADPSVPVADPFLRDHGYRSGDALFGALSSGGAGLFVVRPAPEDEVSLCVAAVAACVDAGRRAVVIVPEASPVPATAAALVAEFGGRVAMFLGGDRRSRYRLWLEISAGECDVVVGTRPAVFAPVSNLGLMWVSRESHTAHREDRAPYFHVRDVAVERASRAEAVCVLSAICPSSEAAALGGIDVAPTRRAWPPVEVVKPGSEGRAPRLVRALRDTTRGFLFAPLPGAGIAQVCRSCGQPAACAACGGVLRSQEGVVVCIVCEASGRCAVCGGARFGILPGGAERVEEWAGRVAHVPVKRVGSRARLPKEREILVGGSEAIRDLGPGNLDLVGVLDADLASRRPGFGAREQALATWMEAVAWARPAGRAIVQSAHAADPAVQAVVRGNPDRFHADEARRRADAGFPVGAVVFRVAGTAALQAELRALEPITLLVSSSEDSTVCLLALAPEAVQGFGALARRLAASQILTRVEAEPHL